MQRYHISGVPDHAATGSRSASSRTATSASRRTSTGRDLARDDEGRPRHGARRAPRMERAKELLHKHRIEKLLVVDDARQARGLITIKDIEKASGIPNACKDEMGRLRVGAAIGVGPDRLDARRRRSSTRASTSIVVDTAHGHSAGVIDAVAEVRRTLARRSRSSPATSPPPRRPRRSSTPAPTPSRSASARARICTTRVVAGVGVPQITAIIDCAARRARARRAHHRRRRHQVLRRHHQGDRRRRRQPS